MQRQTRPSSSSMRFRRSRRTRSGAGGGDASCATGHPWDGLLTASGWYGKQFDGPDAVHPLLFRTPKGTLFPVDPARIPVGIVGRLPRGGGVGRSSAARRHRSAPAGNGPKARLRNLEHRGKVSAAMIYDRLPIIDVFRRVDDVTLLGVMDLRGDVAALLLRADPRPLTEVAVGIAKPGRRDRQEGMFDLDETPSRRVQRSERPRTTDGPGLAHRARTRSRSSAGPCATRRRWPCGFGWLVEQEAQIAHGHVAGPVEHERDGVGDVFRAHPFPVATPSSTWLASLTAHRSLRRCPGRWT